MYIRYESKHKKNKRYINMDNQRKKSQEQKYKIKMGYPQKIIIHGYSLKSSRQFQIMEKINPKFKMLKLSKGQKIFNKI